MNEIPVTLIHNLVMMIMEELYPKRDSLVERSAIMNVLRELYKALEKENELRSKR